MEAIFWDFNTDYFPLKIFNLLTNIEIKTPKTPMMAKEYCRLVNSAINPINGGPIRKPKKLILDTMVSAIPVGTLGLFPAMLITVGITLETPKPTNIKAIVHGIK